ncbi:conjugal transfer protein TraF [Streptococcus castoreus]|uniref:conjugal transfer protein TraF n=1 Tax=Streptococcus castoreus TaxID=254786 RepID=UPI000422D669|nr:conjugal transfer protein TraF [Streptococcus castoreus]
MTFEETIAAFTELKIADVTEVINSGGKRIVFLGRSTCPYCRRFAPKLARVAKDYQKAIFFVNSENMADQADLQEFRQAYQLVTVPALILIDNHQLKAVCDSSLSEEEILRFLES